MKLRNPLILSAALLLSGIAANANAAFIQLFSPAAHTGAITTLGFEAGVVNGPGMSFEPGSSITGSHAHTGTFALAEPSPFSVGPDNLATFVAGVYQVGLWFGNDDTCCVPSFTATLSAFGLGDVLIGSVSLAANMNDLTDQFLGIKTDTLIFKTTLDYGAGNTTLFGIIDDFSYGGNSLAAAPAPSTLALAVLALAGLVSIRRPKR